LVNSGGVPNRINVAVALANNQINGTNFDPLRLVSSEVAASPDRMTSQLAGLIVHTELSADSLRAVRAGLVEQPAVAAGGMARPAIDTGQRPAQRPVAVPVNAASTNDAAAERRRIAQVIGLLMGTTEFQRK